MDIIFLMTQILLLKMNHKTIQSFNQNLSISKWLKQLQLKWLQCGIPRVCQMKILNPTKFQVEFNGSCAKLGEVACAPNEIINLFVTFETKSCPFH